MHDNTIMAIFLLLLIGFSHILGLATAVTLKIAGNASVGNQFCPGSTAEFECQTTEGSLLWETASTHANHIYDNPGQSSKMLGIFLLHLDGISLMNGMVLAVNSTAVVSNIQPSYNGTALKCSEYTELTMFRETVLRVAGPPPAPDVTAITYDHEGGIQIRWSQSDCAVQYVVMIINSSDDRVYPNITTSNTNTTVTLPTGVEFCVTLVAVDSIGRRGPDSVPQCDVLSAATSSVGEFNTIRLSTSSAVMSNNDHETGTLTPTAMYTPVVGSIDQMKVDGVVVVLILLGVLVMLIGVCTLSVFLLLKKKEHCQKCSKPWSVTIRSGSSQNKQSNELVKLTIHVYDTSPSLSRKLHEVSIAKDMYQTFLKETYQQEQQLPKDFNLSTTINCKYSIKLAVISKKDEQPDKITKRTIYGLAEEALSEKSLIALNDILQPDQDGKPVQYVLIDGAPGIGKSTLAWELCHKWEELDSLKQYELVVLIQLRESTAQKAHCLEDLLPCDDTIKIKRVLRAIGNGEGVLIVCDGFDELPQEQRQENSVYIDLLQGKRLRKATVIVTSRPSASADIWRNCKKKTIRHLEIVGFTETEIEQFATNVFSGDILESFLSYITSNPHIYGMMYIPLNAVIIAQIYQDHYNATTPFPKTMSQLFDALTQVLIRRHLLSTHQISHNFTMPSSLHCIHDISKLPPQIVPKFLELAKVAYEGIRKNAFVFTDFDDDFDHLGLMNTNTRLNMHGHKSSSTFLHHTLQEHLAAVHIANQLSSELNSLELQQFLEKKDVLVRFLAGMCDDNHDYSQALRKWFAEFLGQICFDRSRSLQLVHCAYECSNVMQDLEVQYSEENAYIDVEPKIGIDWYAMGHCISHFDERWGLYVTSLREENVSLLVKGLSSSANVKGRIHHLHISKSDLPIYQVLTSFRKALWLCSLELQYVNVNEEDVAVLRQLIAPETGLKSLFVRTINDYTHTSSFIPMLHEDSSLEELVVRTGSKANIDTKLLPCENTNLKKLTISCELVQPLKALLSNTSLTHLVVNSLVYDSDLPIFTSLIQSHSTLQVLELGLIVNYTLTPKPAYAPLESASDNLHQLARASASCRQLKKLKLHEVDYKYNLPKQFQDNSIIVC